MFIFATKNSAALSNARSSLSTKFQGSSHFLRLAPFTDIELSAIAENLFSEPIFLKKDPNFLDKIKKVHSKTA
jgi:hypothetical protein